MTHEDFNKITDLRPYLLHHPNRVMIETSCLHFLGDDAQIWWAKRKEMLERAKTNMAVSLRYGFEVGERRSYPQEIFWKAKPLSPEQIEAAQKAADSCRWLTFKEVEAMRNGTYEQQFGEGITGTTDTIEDLKDL